MSIELIYLIPPLLGGLAYLSKMLDGLGALIAVILGELVLYAAQPGYFWMLVWFLIAGSLITWYKRPLKSRYLPEGIRGVNPVIANGVIPAFLAIYGDLGIFMGALSAAAADTFATEIGMLHPSPVLIHNWKRVTPGVRGAISHLGELGALLGCLAMILGLLGISWSMGWELEPSSIQESIWIALGGGILGCHVDSLLGACLGFLSKEEVNLLGTLSGGLAGLAFVG